MTPCDRLAGGKSRVLCRSCTPRPCRRTASRGSEGAPLLVAARWKGPPGLSQPCRWCPRCESGRNPSAGVAAVAQSNGIVVLAGRSWRRLRYSTLWASLASETRMVRGPAVSRHELGINGPKSGGLVSIHGQSDWRPATHGAKVLAPESSSRPAGLEIRVTSAKILGLEGTEGDWLNRRVCGSLYRYNWNYRTHPEHHRFNISPGRVVAGCARHRPAVDGRHAHHVDQSHADHCGDGVALLRAVPAAALVQDQPDLGRSQLGARHRRAARRV